MLGGILMALVLVVVIPVAVMMTGPVIAAALGWSLKEDAEATHEGSELIALNKQPDGGAPRFHAIAATNDGPSTFDELVLTDPARRRTRPRLVTLDG